MPGSNLWGQSFMKKHENVPTNTGNGGEYTYTSELLKSGAQRSTYTEIMGYFHPSNQHNGSEDASQWEKIRLKHTLFGRDLWHCLNSNIFGIWSVVERCPVATGPHHVYL